MYSQNIDSTEVENFIDRFSKENKISQSEIREILSRATFQPDIIEKISKPAEGLSWERYRNIFMQEDRIQQGVEFWKENQKILDVVAEETGVSIEAIIGILGVETKFGKIKGSYKVLDALFTLGFGYPKRSSFFQSELEHFVLLAAEEGMDLYNVKGSYAGALGYSQFMPSSYRAYAVSFEPEGNRDLVYSRADAIASVANYLKVHRWQQNGPVAIQTDKKQVTGDLPQQSLKPRKTAGYYINLGFEPVSPTSADADATLLEFARENTSDYWLCFWNFYVITRYNHSSLYAMAVHQLGTEISRRIKDEKLN